MKLEELCNNIILAESEGVCIYMEQIDESSMRVGLGTSPGGILKKSLQTFGNFTKKNPFLAGALASYGIDSLKQYKKNKRNTLKFYTKDIAEKNLFKDMIKNLMKSGKYRKEKDTFINGGYLFVLKRLG